MGDIFVSLHATSQPKLTALKGHAPYNAATLTESVMKVMVRRVRERVPGAAALDEDGTLAQLNAEIEDALFAYLRKLKVGPSTLEISTSGIFFSSDLLLEMTCEDAALSQKPLKLHVDWKGIRARMGEAGKVAAVEKKINLKALTVLSHPDIGPRVRKKLSRPASDAFKVLMIPVEVEITDTGTLNQLVTACGGNPLLLQKLKDAADFTRLTGEIAEAAEEIYAEASKAPTNAGALQAELQLNVSELILDAAERATAEIQKSAKIRLERNKYLIKSGIKLALNVSGTAFAIAGVAVSGLSGGVSGIYSLIQLVQSVANTAVQIRDLARTAERVQVEYLRNLEIIKKRYEDVHPATVGVMEVALETASMALLTENALPSIGTCRRLLDLWSDKANGLVVNAENMSEKLDKVMNQAKVAEANLTRAKQAGLAGLPRDAETRLAGLIDKVKSLEKSVHALIGDVVSMHDRADNMYTEVRKESALFAPIEAQKPRWADATTALISLGKGVAGVAAGGVGMVSVLDKVSVANDIVALAVEAHDTARDLVEMASSASKKR